MATLKGWPAVVIVSVLISLVTVVGYFLVLPRITPESNSINATRVYAPTPTPLSTIAVEGPQAESRINTSPASVATSMPPASIHPTQPELPSSSPNPPTQEPVVVPTQQPVLVPVQQPVPMPVQQPLLEPAIVPALQGIDIQPQNPPTQQMQVPPMMMMSRDPMQPALDVPIVSPQGKPFEPYPEQAWTPQQDVARGTNPPYIREETRQGPTTEATISIGSYGESM